MHASGFHPSQVLGVREYHHLLHQHELQQQLLLDQPNTQQQQQQQTRTQNAIDASTLPPDVWQAACLLGDKGVQLIHYYRELQDCREAAVQQMAVNSSIRALTQLQEPQQRPQVGISVRGSSGAGGAVGQLLSKPTVMDAIKQSHDARVMAAWDSQQAAWQQQARHLAAVAHKDPEQLALLTAGDDFRHKQELLSALEVAVPAAAAAEHKGNKRSPMDTNNRDGHDGDKGSIGDGGPVGAVACASGNWMSSLRNANERLLQVGNIFSGLYVSLRNNSTVAAAGLTSVRKPVEEAFEAHIPGGAAADTTAAALSRQCQGPASGCAFGGATTSSSGGSIRSSMRDKWSQQPYLQEKLRAGSAAVKVLHTPTVDASQLAVRGWSIKAALSSSPLTHAPVSLADVERRLAVADPALWQEYQAAQQRQAAKAAAAEAAADLQARRAAARTAAAQLPRPGPHLSTSDTSLSMHVTLQTPVSNDNPRLEVQHTFMRPSASWAAISSNCDDAQQQTAVPSHVAEFTVVSTGTAAVYYSWASEGRQRLPLVTAAASSGSNSSAAGGAAAGAAGMSQAHNAPLFTLPELHGVILPGETKVFKFSFTPSCPGVYHESWSCFTHPPLEPPADRSRRRGEPICLQLKGIAVTDGDSGGPTLVAAERLQQDVHNKTRDAQVSAALSHILDRVQQQQQRVAKVTQQGVCDDPQISAQWLAANPPGSCGCNHSSTQPPLLAASTCPSEEHHMQQPQHGQSEEQPRVAELCCHYYSAAAHARLSDIYSRARSLLQPAAPVVEPTKKGGATAATGSTKPSSNKAKEQQPAEPAEAPLPEVWDCSIAGLKVLLGRLQQLAHRQQAAVLQQQMEVVLRAAAVPSTQHQLVEATCRYIVLRMADAVDAAAQAAAPPSTEVSSTNGSKSHRAKGVDAPITSRHASSSGGAADGSAAARGHARSSSTASSVGAGHRGKGDASSAGAGGVTSSNDGAVQQLYDDVWAESQQSCASFEAVLASFKAAANAAVDARAAAAVVELHDEGSETPAWEMFAAARQKRELGLV